MDRKTRTEIQNRNTELSSVSQVRIRRIDEKFRREGRKEAHIPYF